MYSLTPPDAIPFQLGPSLLLPWAAGKVAAGFPSSAADFAIKRHDLNELLISHPLATFMWQARGVSMVGYGIFEGDILVCNRALEAVHGDIVIAEYNDEFVVKMLWKQRGMIQLRSGNPHLPSLIFKDGQMVTCCGVVTATIKRFKR